jgi:hypothetical protein
MGEETPEQVTLDNLLPLGYVQKRGDATSQICTRCGALVWVSEDDERTEAEEIHSQWHAAIEDLTITVQVKDGRQLTIDPSTVELGPVRRINPGTRFERVMTEGNEPESVQGSNMLRIPFTPEQRRELVMALGLDPNQAADCTWPAIMDRVLRSAAALTQTDQPLRDQLIQQLKDTSINHPAAVVDLLMPVIGVWRGEVERLRRIEQALIDVGAPNRSERGDPGGLTVAWIQRQAELMSELRAKDQAAKQAVKLLAERPTQDAYVLALEEPERCRSGLVEALGLDQNTGFYAALDVVREYVAERSSTVTTVDTGGHRVTVHMDPALPEDWQQQVATVIEQAEDAASEIVTRIAYWLGVGKVHTCEAHCSLEHVEEGLDNTKPVTDQVLSDLLLLVNVTVTPEQLASWTREQREQAANWAGLVHLDASDNDVGVPERPAFLDRPRCVAHGNTGCVQCSLNPADCGSPSGQAGCATYLADGMHWDTCPNRVQIVHDNGTWELTTGESISRLVEQVCPSLCLYRDGDVSTLVSCKATWEHDRHQNTPTGSGDVVWFDQQAVPSPWPVDQEPPAGINCLRDTDAPGAFRYLYRVAKHWVWSDKPAIPHGPYQMLPWAEASMEADGDLVVVRP